MTDQEQYLEDQIRQASGLLAMLESIYRTDKRILISRIDYWTSVRVQAEEKLYNLRNGDNGKV